MGRPTRKTPNRHRMNLRLDAPVLTAVHEACRRRPGTVSRSTWITEAILEKLKREGIRVPEGE